jgi:formate hydrogenlyase transcriptional activator
MNLPLDSFLQRGFLEYLVLDDRFGITEISPGAARLAEDPSAALIGRNVCDAFPEFIGLEDEMLQVLEGKKSPWSIRNICRSRIPDTPLYVSLSIASYHNDGAQKPVLTVVLEDVSEWMVEIQRRAQTSNDALLLVQTLAASKAYIESVFDAMAEVVIIATMEGMISTVNRATLDLFGYAQHELPGRHLSMLLSGERLPEATAAGLRYSGVELAGKHRTGDMIPLSFSRTPLEAGTDTPGGLIYVGRDLRESKRAEAKIVKLETVNTSLQEALIPHEFPKDIIWSSPAMADVMRGLQKVAGTESTVLIVGETGTGKELVARAIHRSSSRRDRIMITVNCAAMPEGLVESEIFGHEKGAFTGAMQRRLGRFELADGGTLFFDEVGELPLATQATLLRVLQEQAFERVGGSHTVKVNVRVIAATNRDLAVEVEQGRFREDLLFRLNVFPLHVPPLRDRKEDIPLLARHFIQQFARRTNKRVTSVSPSAMESLQHYAWPGNVRELANSIERAMIVCDGSTITQNDFALVDAPAKPAQSQGTFDEVAREHLMRTLQECNGVIEGPRGAAARLGLKPATLRSRMKKLGLQRMGGGFTVSGQE